MVLPGKLLLVIGILGGVVIVVAASLSFTFSYTTPPHDQNLLEQSSAQVRDISLGELANSIKPIYPDATVVFGKLPSSIDGITLREVAKNTVSNSITRDQKVGVSRGIEKDGLAEITLYMAAADNDNNIIAASLTNIGKDRFYLKQFAIGGQTLTTGIAPLEATILDSDYSPEVWANIPKPVLTQTIVMNPGDSISAYIKGKYNEQFTGEPIDVFGGSASWYYDQDTENYNNGFGWGVYTCSNQSRC